MHPNRERMMPTTKQNADERLGAMTGSGSFFREPPVTPFNFLSLGAGVQSSCLALMAATGEIGPVPDAAIFADTQAEPESVYRWLGWLTAKIQTLPHPFPVLVVTKGSLTDHVLRIRETKKGTLALKTGVPFFTLQDGCIYGKLPGRPCTVDFKVNPITQKIRSLAAIKRGQKEVTVTQWIGISWDELTRVKNAKEKWSQHRWPLLELRMRRGDCIDWMQEHGFPEPPRSACTFCPFHDNAEWRRMKDHEPSEFAAAVEFERELHRRAAQTNELRTVPFLHRSCVPLDEVDLSTENERGQLTIDFKAECEGMCGL